MLARKEFSYSFRRLIDCAPHEPEFYMNVIQKQVASVLHAWRAPGV